MKSIQLALSGVLLAVGLVLHAVIPGILGAMKFDMLLTMMFLAIILFPNIKSVAVTALATGVISALTTTFPGGQLANMIDKPITAIIVFGLYSLLKKYHGHVALVATITAIGTLISGTIFLTSAAVITGLPAPFVALFLTVVLPTTVVNTIVMTVLYPILQTITKRSNLIYQT
ncbi:tryptophan transporter [Pseudalkalibacillus berkeleyi]|uniref:Tryptophan transporter n=1 Tax=Pseudalkalibacillus berkeleyi TaxID=1069813 RepID=A0ABS9GWS8_9BACL|nr:tryptophan transporter [Pseudalkalibacillus berkeleyi]MCF6136181.1 tryptophan transporter [Pseudalkalibacillus berkeleyi]